MSLSPAHIDRAREHLARWVAQPWDEVARMARDEPELCDLGAVDRALLVVAAMHGELQWTSREMRRVVVDHERPGQLLLRAPERNPFASGEGLPEPWLDGVWFRVREQEAGVAAAHAWLQELSRHTMPFCDSAEGQCAFAATMCELVARDLGPASSWRVYHEVGGPPLEWFCCGYDAMVVRSGDGAVLFATGMYC